MSHEAMLLFMLNELERLTVLTDVLHRSGSISRDDWATAEQEVAARRQQRSAVCSPPWRVPAL